jgi:hypothetical protein
MGVSIYDQLAKTKLAEAELTDLNTGSDMTYVDKNSVDYWRNVITIWRALEASRTYPGGGMPIPESSTVETLTIADSAVGTMKPQNTEIWRVQAIKSTAAVTLSLFDGTRYCQISAASSDPFVPTEPLFLTPTLYLSIANASGGEATLNMAYHKVGL